MWWRGIIKHMFLKFSVHYTNHISSVFLHLVMVQWCPCRSMACGSWSKCVEKIYLFQRLQRIFHACVYANNHILPCTWIISDYGGLDPKDHCPFSPNFSSFFSFPTSKSCSWGSGDPLQQHIVCCYSVLGDQWILGSAPCISRSIHLCKLSLNPRQLILISIHCSRCQE